MLAYRRGPQMIRFELSVRRTSLVLLMWLVVGLGLLSWSSPGIPEEAESDCNVGMESKALVGCVGGLIRKLESTSASNQLTFEKALSPFLQKLAQTFGYYAAPQDLAQLKRLSRTLKSNPLENCDAIAILDRAVASNENEIGPAVSPKPLAARATPGDDIYAPFTNQKLSFLTSERADFYDGGPFELTWRYLLVGALESKIFY